MAAPFFSRAAELNLLRRLLKQHPAATPLDIAELSAFHGGPDFSLLLPKAPPAGVGLGTPLRWFDYC
jgi:hypothetical protein